MAKVSNYVRVTTLNDGLFLYTAIDTDSDGIYESAIFTLATLRAAIYDTNSNIIKMSVGGGIATAATLVLGTDGNYFTVAGGGTITAIQTVKVGTVVTLDFFSISTLQHSANLELPGELDITVQNGDQGTFIEYATGQWRCINFQRLNFPPPQITSLVPRYVNASPQALSGPGAVDIVTPITNFTSVGATDALTLADGTEIGQMKVINHEVDGGGYVLTPNDLLDGTTITVTDVGVSITLMWTDAGWRLISQTGVATIA